MTPRERPSQQASHMRETFLCTGTEAIKSTKPVAHPVPNPRRNAKHGCLERQSEEISGEKSKNKSRCNTSQVERQSLRRRATACRRGQEGMDGSVYREKG